MPNRNGINRRSTNLNKFRSDSPVPNQIFLPDDTTSYYAAEGGLPNIPKFLSAEMWILQGGGMMNANIPKSVTSPPSQRSIQTPPITTEPAPRGRSPKQHPHTSPQRSSSHHVPPNHTGCRHGPEGELLSVVSSSSSPPPPKLVTSEHGSSPSSVAVVPSMMGHTTTSLTSPKSNKTSSRECAPLTAPFGKPKHDVAFSSAACPIPSTYILYIRKAFGGNSSVSSYRPIDLYTEVLGLPHQPSPYTDAQIRVAYFRQGRLALQQSSVGKSNIVHVDPDTNNTTVMPSKQLFQAITKAYEVVTNPCYKAYYETYGLPPLKPDAPSTAVEDVIQRNRSIRANTALPTEAPPTTTRISRHIDHPVAENPYGTCHTKPTRGDDLECKLKKMKDPPIVLHDDADDSGSVVSFGSILRYTNNKNKNRQRSKSWGPAVSSSSRQRVVWKEMVQELIYQPDPPSNHSVEELMEHQQQQQQQQHFDPHSNLTIDDRISGPLTIRSKTQLQQEIEDRDFLDELEASVDGIGESIGNFVKYLSEKNGPSLSTGVKNGDNNDTTSSELKNKAPTKTTHGNNWSHDDCQVFNDLPKEPESVETDKVDVGSVKTYDSSDGGGAYAKRIAEYNRRSHSCDEKTYNGREKCKLMTTTTPLKEGKSDREPRKKPKKSKRKKIGVDKVPSAMTNSDYDVFDPFQYSIDASVDFGAIDPLIDVWNSRVPQNDCGVNHPIVPTKNTVLGTTKVDVYELPEVSSILASLDGATHETFTVDLDGEKSMSFDEALNRTTDATTKGYIRLNRRVKSLSAVSGREPSMDVSEITYSSNASDDPAGRHFHFAFLTSLTESAKATIKEIASFDEEKVDMSDPTAKVNCKAATSALQQESTPSSNATRNPPNNVDLFSQCNTFMQSLMDDMNKLGAQITTNFMETNRAVRDQMTFPEAEMSGFLERIGTELQLTKSKDVKKNPNNLHPSYTY